MRILFVTPYIPSSIRVRPLNFIRQLSKRHQITLISLMQGDASDAEAVEQLREFCEDVYVFPLSKTRSLANCCRKLLTSMPLQAAYTHMPEGRAFVSRIAQSRAFDVLHVEHIRGAHLAQDVRSVPRVYDSVDCITRLLKQRLSHERGTFQWALSYEELVKMRSYEPRVASTFDNVVVTSDHDKRALSCLIRRLASSTADEIGKQRALRSLIEESQDIRLEGLGDGLAGISVIRNGVDSDYFHPIPEEPRPASIVFSGKMCYYPNASAAIRFYDEVLPLVRSARPDATFKIVGSDPPGSVLKLSRDPAVEITGYVPDIRSHLAAGQVIACPLDIGVGIQNKVLEAMAMGKPVVATSVACSGIPDAVDGRHIVIANNSEKMASAILHLMEYPEYARAVGEQARRLVQDRYSWDTAAKQLEAIYTKATDLFADCVPVAA
jgi:polysaccharide biosynthesis protein PslH